MLDQHFFRVTNCSEVVRFVPFVQHIDIGHQLIFLVIGERNTCLFQQTREFIEHGGYLLRNLSGGWRFANPPYGFSRPGKRSATGQYFQRLKSKKPALKAGFLNLAPLTGLEPVTYGLTVRRSTD